MTSAQIVEMSVTNNSSFQNYPQVNDHTIQTRGISSYTDPFLGSYHESFLFKFLFKFFLFKFQILEEHFEPRKILQRGLSQ